MWSNVTGVIAHTFVIEVTEPLRCPAGFGRLSSRGCFLVGWDMRVRVLFFLAAAIGAAALGAAPAVVASGPTTILASCGGGYLMVRQASSLSPVARLPELPLSAEMATTHSAPTTPAHARATAACRSG
jgi:hypothetical protein